MVKELTNIRTTINTSNKECQITIWLISSTLFKRKLLKTISMINYSLVTILIIINIIVAIINITIATIMIMSISILIMIK